MRHFVPAILLSWLLPGVCFADSSAVAVLPFELNDLTLDPGNAEEVARTASIAGLLDDALARRSHRTVAIDPQAYAQANEGFGYLFEHADVAAQLTRSAGADWAVVGRLHKASFLFVYLIAQVVDARTGEVAGELKVEIKGPQKALTMRGVDNLAQQIDELIRKRAPS
jgi:hypothetical protein